VSHQDNIFVRTLLVAYFVIQVVHAREEVLAAEAEVVAQAVHLIKQ
jgi:hypothetical protein